MAVIPKGVLQCTRALYLASLKASSSAGGVAGGVAGGIAVAAEDELSGADADGGQLARPSTTASGPQLPSLSLGSTPIPRTAPHKQEGTPATKVAVRGAAAALGNRLSEATTALVDAPIREAAAHVALIKDIALAIKALEEI